MSKRTLSVVLGIALALPLGAPLFAQDDLGSLLAELSPSEREGLALLNASYTIGCEVVFGDRTPVAPPDATDVTDTTSRPREVLHLGAFEGATRLSHFDVIRDTPGFCNAAVSAGTKKLGNGACLGISKFIAKCYKDVRFPEDGEDPISFRFHNETFRNVSHPDLRSFSLDETYRQDLYDCLKEYTQNAGQKVTNFFRSIGGWGDEECYSRILEFLEKDEVPVLIFKGGVMGWHAVNAYKVLHFSERSLVFFHENNAVYEADSEFIPRFVLIYEHETKTLRAPDLYGNVDIKVTGI